jgi:hypothetical protein
MNTAEPGQVVKERGQNHGLRILRKPFQWLAPRLVPPEGRLPVEKAKGRRVFSARFQEEMGAGDQEHRAVGRRVPRGVRHVHHLLQPPRLLGLPEGKRAWDAKTVILTEGCVTAGQIPPPQHDRGPGVRLERALDDADDMPETGNLVVPQLGLRPGRLAGLLPGGRFRDVPGLWGQSPWLPYGRRGPLPAEVPAEGQASAAA